MNHVDLHYNYVYFNNCTSENENEYNAICLRDAAKMEGVDVIPFPMAGKSSFVRRIYNIHNSIKHNSKIKLPFKSIWYPILYTKTFNSKKPICFVFGSTNIPIGYYSYLKKHFSECKIVKVHRDLLKITHQNPEYTEKKMNEVFDLRLSYDEEEAKQYGILAFNEIESKIEIPIDANYPLCDVFFAGKAKDRMPKILKAYEIFTAAGLKCDFFITHAREEEKVNLPGITYSDRFMPYDEMLYRSVNAKCMLDINQTGAVGYTSRFLEAVIYNKKLIADNPSIRSTKYYNPNFIQLVDKMDDIDPEFVKNDITPDYQYEGDFSPIHLLKQIDDELLKQERRTAVK